MTFDTAIVYLCIMGFCFSASYMACKNDNEPFHGGVMMGIGLTVLARFILIILGVY